MFCVVLPAFSSGAAVYGGTNAALTTLLPALIGAGVSVGLVVLFGAWRSRFGFTRQRRALLRDVRRSGVACGDYDVDRRALTQVEDALKGLGQRPWAVGIVYALVDAVPIIAAVRDATLCLVLLAVVPLQALVVLQPWRRELQQRADRLRGSIGDPTPWWHYQPARS